MRRNLEIEYLGDNLAPSTGFGAEPQSQTVFGKYLIEWSSFSSTVYHVRKTPTDFEQVDEVCNFILFSTVHFL